MHSSSESNSLRRNILLMISDHLSALAVLHMCYICVFLYLCDISVPKRISRRCDRHHPVSLLPIITVLLTTNKLPTVTIHDGTVGGGGVLRGG
jgi:hypothetical protein